MGKSSSSTKKKRSKISSKSKASKGKIRSKTRRNNKHKKHQYRDDSVSYSSDCDDLSSSTSISLSSSDYDHRSRRSKSRTQRDVKTIKKKARRRSSSLESSGESPPRGKKRKRSEGKDDFGTGKKTYVKKKKFKQDMSVRSRDSGSSSCSTCNGGSSSTDKSDDEKKKGKSKTKDKDRKRSDKVKKKSSRRRADLGTRLSCDPCSSDVEEKENEDEEESYYEVNLRRLKSVIVVRDKHKDEMVYDHHDYWPSRSNDGNDGDGVKELLDNSPTGSKTTRQEKDEKEEEAVDGHEGRYDGSDFADDGVRMNDLLNEVKNEDSGIVEMTEGNDLESILRQKALENLKKFKKVGGDRVADANDAVEQNIFPNRIAGREECGPNVGPANNSNTPSNEPKLVGLAPQQESSNAMEEPRQGGDSMKGNTVGKNDVETAQTLIPKSGNINGQEVKNNCGSASGDNPCTVPASAGSSNESSQFQQKTMTVMQGGEMVEVSYKVYIPKKASALARRQLKRQ